MDFQIHSSSYFQQTMVVFGVCVSTTSHHTWTAKAFIIYKCRVASVVENNQLYN
jgi:hypothetical protein